VVEQHELPSMEPSLCLARVALCLRSAKSHATLFLLVASFACCFAFRTATTDRLPSRAP